MEKPITEILSLQKWGGSVPAEAYANAEEVAKANYVAGLYKNNKLVRDFAADIMIMGYIYGQRAERERRKASKRHYTSSFTKKSQYNDGIQALVSDLNEEEIKRFGACLLKLRPELVEERG